MRFSTALGWCVSQLLYVTADPVFLCTPGSWTPECRATSLNRPGLLGSSDRLCFCSLQGQLRLVTISDLSSVLTPRVCLCTITSNRPRLLQLLAHCVLALDYPKACLEWVIIDDSACSSVARLEDIHRSGIELKHIHLKDRLTIGAKRNLCHEYATGDFFVILDDDDYYPPSRVTEAVAAFSDGETDVAGCDRYPLLLLPEGKYWFTPMFSQGHATANTLAYTRSYLKAGHCFDCEVSNGEEAIFLDQFQAPLRQLNPLRTITCIDHGGNTVNKRLWMARIGLNRFEHLPSDTPGLPPVDYLDRYRAALNLPGPKKAPSGKISTGNLSQVTPKSWRVAVITPYHDEPVELLARCHRSVLMQEYPCTHVLVADGPGQTAVSTWACRHIVLGVGHHDNGNTPRSIGALAAMNEGFDSIAFLDVDNWFAPDHIKRAIDTQLETDCSVVFSDRHIVFPSGQRLTSLPHEDLSRRHVDTSCMVLFASSFCHLACWSQMPRLFSQQCDRVMFAQLMANQRCAWTGATTVFYETWYANHFLTAGLLPPLNAKFISLHPASEWSESAELFRQRCPFPVYLGSQFVGSDKPRIEIVSLLGPSRSGGTLLQHLLCHHLGFRGIPEHQFLYHCVMHQGPDHRLRHQGEALKLALAQGLLHDSRLKPYDRVCRGLEQSLRVDRSYTLLEAYFRAVQALLPREAKDFALAYGKVTVLDRSCSHALVADVLYQCLPDHRAVLLLRNPLEQITSVLVMGQQFPADWDSDQRDRLRQLCETYLQSLVIPLHAAPVGQLRLVPFDSLLTKRGAVVEQVCRFLGLEPNTLPALQPLELTKDHFYNSVYNESYTARCADVSRQFVTSDESWKQIDLPSQLQKRPKHYNFSDSDREWLLKLMKPICLALEFLTQPLSLSKLDQFPRLIQPVNQRDSLQASVELVIDGLRKHALSVVGN